MKMQLIAIDQVQISTSVPTDRVFYDWVATDRDPPPLSLIHICLSSTSSLHLLPYLKGRLLLLLLHYKD